VGNLFLAPRPLHQRIPDFKPNRSKLSLHLMIPESQRFDPLHGKKALALFIVLPLFRNTMSTAVEFNRQPGLDAIEIQEVVSARVLTPKFEMVETTVTQQTPQAFSCVSRLFAESSGEFAGGHGSRAPDTPHPDPLPSEGRGDSRSGFFRCNVELLAQRFHFTVVSFYSACRFTFT
jgi:hypothetical protein